jgi:hypothetical protein
MTAATAPSPTRRSLADAPWFNSRLLWTLVAVSLSAVLYLSTVQTIINSSGHPYVTDVGEHQNALPRWGLIHHSGYPQWTALGSLSVTALRVLGVAPAAGASLYSLAWGLLTVALLVLLAMELGAPGPFAALGALAAAVATSVWVDASIAELHTATMAVTVAALWLALRFGRTGSRGDLLWLVFVTSQGVFHQRSIVLLGPAVLVLIAPHLLDIFRMGWRTWALIIGIALLAPLTYLYLPFRVWTGADWVFGSPGTWDGFWSLFFDNRADRIFDLQTGWAGRARTTLDILNDDLWLPLLAVGLVGLWVPFVDGLSRRAERVAGQWSPALTGFLISLGLTLAWLPNLLVTILIWRNRVTDAQLAAKLPVVLLAGVGLALILGWLWRRWRWAAAAAAVALAGLLVFWAVQTRPFVLSITRDDSTQALVDVVDRVPRDPDGRTTTVTLPWGTDYWTLTYAQGFQDRLAGLNLVDHNADPRAIIARGDRLLAPNQTFYVFPLSYFEERLGPLYLASAAPGVVEMSPTPIVTNAGDGAPFDLGNGIVILSAEARWVSDSDIVVTVAYQAAEAVAEDYSVAVHLVANDPPQGEADILDQDDKAAPVDNWYPTSQWRPGEIVRDTYLVSVPPGSAPVAIRLGMYRTDPAAGFVNTPWLSLPLP